jgi:hypothetical protein
VSASGRGQTDQGLPPPPPLAESAGGSMAGPSTELDSINWNLMDIGAVYLDDMDLDFAQLFDPENELANMQTVGSGWPLTGASTTEQGTMSVASSEPPPTAGNTS